MDWSDHFYYDETSPSCLRWARPAANNRVKVGDVAGAFTAGYYQIKVDTVDGLLNVRAHRIVWEMFHGAIPDGMVVDHFDRDVGNNRIVNLRVVTNRDNCQNRRTHPLNKSGVIGVHLKNNGRGSYYWCAQWMTVDGRKKVVNFSVASHGEDEAFRLACETRQLAIEKLNADGCSYTNHHGKELHES